MEVTHFGGGHCAVLVVVDTFNSSAMSSAYAFSNPLYDYCPFAGRDTDDDHHHDTPSRSEQSTGTPSRPTPKPRTSLRKHLNADKQVAGEAEAEDERKHFDEETDRMAALLDEIETIANSFTAKLSHEEGGQQQQQQQTLTERLEAVLEQDEASEQATNTLSFADNNNPSRTSTPSPPPPRHQPLSRKRVPVSSMLLKMQFSSVSTVNEEDMDEDKSFTSFTSSSSSSSSPPTVPSDNPASDSTDFKAQSEDTITAPPPKLPPKRGQPPPKHPLPPIPVAPRSIESEAEIVDKKMATMSPKTTPTRSVATTAFNIRFELLSLEHLHGNNHKVQRAGYLWKTGPNYKAFKNRWCVLSRHALDVGGQFVYYFNQQSMATSLTGKIMLADVEFIGAIESISSKTRPPKLSANERGTSIKNEFTFFKLGVRPRQGRVYLLAARSHSELQLWLHSFLQALSLHSVKNKEIYQCGFLRTRFTITGRWQLGLALLTTDRCLYLFEMTPGGELARVVDCKSYQIFNLRKTVRLASFDSNGFSLTQNGGRVVYLASEFEPHIVLWREAVERFWRTPEVLEKSILAEQYLTKENVPVAIDKCLKFLDTFNRIGGKLFTEAGEKELKDFLQACSNNSTATTTNNNSGSLLPFEQLGNVLAELRANAWEVHLLPQRLSAQHVAFLLFQYLKSMNECILTDLTLSEWIQVTEEDIELEARRAKLKRLLQMLPVVNYSSLRRIIIYLANQSMEGPFSISVCKSLVFTKHIALVRIPLASARALLAALIHDYLALFEVTPEEIEKELQIKRVAQLIITQNKEGATNNNLAASLVAKTSVLAHGAGFVTPAAGHCSVTSGGNILVSRKVSVLIIGIRLHLPSGGVSTMNVHLNKDTTAANVLDMMLAEKISSKGSPLNRSTFGLLELVCYRRLERLINEEEKILPIVLSWSEWPSRWSAEACLEVRRLDSLYCLEQETSTGADKNSYSSSSSSSTMLMSVIRFASTTDVRPSRKVLAELSRTMLTLFCKDTNSVVARWNITTDILWYVGLEATGLVHNRHMALDESTTTTTTNVPIEPSDASPPALTIVECADTTIHGRTGLSPARHNFGCTLLFNTNTERAQWIRAMLETSRGETTNTS